VGGPLRGGKRVRVVQSGLFTSRRKRIKLGTVALRREEGRWWLPECEARIISLNNTKMREIIVLSIRKERTLSVLIGKRGWGVGKFSLHLSIQEEPDELRVLSPKGGPIRRHSKKEGQ